MPDKKLTDNEIVKALEICSKYTSASDCKKCPLKPNCDVNVLETLSLDLFNRLQAENERLKEKICIQHKIIDERGAEVLRHDRCIRTLHEKLETAKAEAYKEFADKVKQEIDNIRRNAPSRHIGVFIKYLLCLQQKINDLLKELVGDK